MKCTDVSAAERPARPTTWLGRIGKLGFAFFFVKGLAWLVLPAALWLMD